MAKKVPQAPPPETKPDTQPALPDQETIAVRAYQLWMLRGCPLGSPDVDWEQAEQELLQTSQGRQTGQTQTQAA